MERDLRKPVHFRDQKAFGKRGGLWFHLHPLWQGSHFHQPFQEQGGCFRLYVFHFSQKSQTGRPQFQYCAFCIDPVSYRLQGPETRRRFEPVQILV